MRAGEAFDHLDQIRVLCCVVSATEHNCFGDRTRLLNRLRMFKMRRVKNKHRKNRTPRFAAERTGRLAVGVAKFHFPARLTPPHAVGANGVAKVRFFLAAF